MFIISVQMVLKSVFKCIEQELLANRVKLNILKNFEL